PNAPSMLVLYENEGMPKRVCTCSQTHTRKKKKKVAGKAPTRHKPPPPHKKTVAATYSPTPPQGSTISVRRLHDRVRKETGYNPSTKTTTEKHVNKHARTPSYLQRTSPRPISPGQLHPTPGLSTPSPTGSLNPSKEAGDLISKQASRLDAFSGYPSRT